MANKIVLKKSSVASKVPLTSDIDYGELAINYADGKAYYKTSSNTIDYLPSAASTSTLTNKTLTSPTINDGALSGSFSGSITLSDTTASTSTSTGALKIGGGLGVAGSIYADQIRLTNNGNGTNVYIGDDVVLGDVNTSNTLGIRGIQDASKGYIIFGNANSTSYIGRDGTNPITVTGQFTVDSGAVSGTNGIALQITGYASKGGTGYHDFLKVTNTYASATNSNKFFRLNSAGQFEIVNSAYSATILSLSDAGVLGVNQISVGGTTGTSGQVLQSTGTGMQWAAAGSGTVTNVATGSGLTGGPITTTGTISLATAYGDTVNPYASKTANYVLAAPNGSAGVPTFRALVAADIPTLNQNTTGTASNITAYTINQNLGTSNTVTFDQVIATNNGNGTNFKVGDDAWIGDVNAVNTIRITGVQDATKGYLIFGNGDTTALGRTGTGALTYGGNTVWHAGNDGSASGLDADLLDGYQSSVTSSSNTVVVRDANQFIAISGINLLTNDATAPTSVAASWNSTDATWDFQLKNGVTLQAGQELQFYGRATEAIPNGSVVMFAGAQGDGILLAKADVNAVGFHPSWIVGIATQDIAINNWGYVTWFGKIHDVNTYGLNLGDVLYLSTSTPGALTTTLPVAPKPKVRVAAVLRVSNSSSSNDGILMTRPDFADKLSELQDVYINSVANGDVIMWNSTSGRWENKTQSNITAGDSDKVDGYHASTSSTASTVVARDTNGAITVAGVISQPQIFNVTNSTTNLDLSLADNWHLTLQSNTTFTLSNIAAKIGSSGSIILIQDATGGRTFTKATEMKTPLHGATIVQTTTANTISVLTYYVVSASFVIVNYIGDFA